jgi:hypothetical protein
VGRNEKDMFSVMKKKKNDEKKEDKTNKKYKNNETLQQQQQQPRHQQTSGSLASIASPLALAKQSYRTGPKSIANRGSPGTGFWNSGLNYQRVFE